MLECAPCFLPCEGFTGDRGGVLCSSDFIWHHLWCQELPIFSLSNPVYTALSRMICWSLMLPSPLAWWQLWGPGRQKWISQACSVRVSGKTAIDSNIFISQQKVPEVELQSIHACTSLHAWSSPKHWPSCECWILSPHFLSGLISQQNSVQSHRRLMGERFPSAYGTAIHCCKRWFWNTGWL